MTPHYRLIGNEDREVVRTYFSEHVSAPVTITLFTQTSSLLVVPGRDCPSCDQTQQLLEEVAELSEHITLDVHNFRTEFEHAEDLGIARIPAFILQGKAKGAVRYFGPPAGYEFATLIHDLEAVSSGEVDLSEATKTALGELKEDVHIQVFGTPG
jgi:thiol-disulfide isomerase/thioredoxin